MAPQVDTAQRRAEALLLELRQVDKRHADEGVAFVTELLDPIIEFEQQARREALEDAAKVARDCESIAEPGQVRAAYRYVADAIDRLREGRE